MTEHIKESTSNCLFDVLARDDRRAKKYRSIEIEGMAEAIVNCFMNMYIDKDTALSVIARAEEILEVIDYE